MPDTTTPEAAERMLHMGVLARASFDAIAALLQTLPALPTHTRLRGPETGLAMVRGRMGGSGDAFNLGEMTLTRCTVRTADGHVGHAYVAGRDQRQAELAALIDAAMRDPQREPDLRRAVIAPLAAQQQEARARKARQAAATGVQFFTMATMRS